MTFTVLVVEFFLEEILRKVGAVGFDFTESALNDDVDNIEQTAMTAKVVAILSRVFISPIPHRTPKSGRIQK